MAQFDNISDSDRKLVADQAAPLLLQLQGPRLGGPGAPMVLGTSIGEEMITPEWVNAENDDVAKTALRTTGQTISIVQTKDPGAGLGDALEFLPRGRLCAPCWRNGKRYLDTDHSGVWV